MLKTITDVGSGYLVYERENIHLRLSNIDMNLIPHYLITSCIKI
jgi:hypothetical protein